MRSSSRPSTVEAPLRRRPQQPDRDAQEGRRRRAAQLFKEGHTQADVARILKVSRQSVSRWYESWRSGETQAVARARSSRLWTLQSIRMALPASAYLRI